MNTTGTFTGSVNGGPEIVLGTNQVGDAAMPQVYGESATPAPSECRRYKVMAEHRGTPMQIGLVCKTDAGWRYSPFYQENPSRKPWPSPESALKGRVKNYTLVEDMKP